jgi:rod shape-determining protein MreC
MESLLNRYRNITVLLLVIFAQLVLVAVQVKNDQDVRMIRVWAVSAVTPLARVLEGIRSGSIGFLNSYVTLRQAEEQNRRIRSELERLKLENQFLKAELATSERAKALAAFQSRTPSRTLAARVIGTGAGVNSKVVFVDRGSAAGVQRGMAVVTPDGIVGKVIGAFPTASQVELVTDADFAAGVVSQKGHVRGTLKGQGHGTCKVDYIQSEEKIEVGEWFYTSGDDRVFPRGFPAGIVRAVRPASPFQEILVEPVGLRGGLEEVLILLEGVHQEFPETAIANSPVYLAPPLPAPPDATDQPPLKSGAVGTDADRLAERYKAVGEAQGHKFGEGLPGSKPPDFNLKTATPGQGRSASSGETPPANPATASPQNTPAATPAARPRAPEDRKPEGSPPPIRPAPPPQ